jgi:hypothetical protein
MRARQRENSAHASAAPVRADSKFTAKVCYPFAHARDTHPRVNKPVAGALALILYL